MLRQELEEALIADGATQGLIWEIRHILSDPSVDELPYKRFHREDLSLYVYKDNPRYIYCIPMFEGAYRGSITRLNLTEGLKDLPNYLIKYPTTYLLLTEALEYLQLPKGYIYHVCSVSGLRDNHYIGGPELYAGWEGKEQVTFIDTSNWEMKELNLETLVSLREYLPKDVTEVLIKLTSCCRLGADPDYPPPHHH